MILIIDFSAWGLYIYKRGPMDTISIPHIISVLPLPHLVFFPHTHLSLHIPRSFYDRMKEGSQPYPPQADAFLGIVLRKAQPLDEAAVLPIGCVGKVIRFHYLPCGQAVHLDLHGLKRFRMKEGWFEEGYGQAWIEAIEDQPGSLCPGRKRDLLEVLEHLGHMKEWAPELQAHIKSGLDDEVFLNMLCLESGLSPMGKYFLLEADDLNQRSGRLIDLLRFKLADIRSNGGACQKDH